MQDVTRGTLAYWAVIRPRYAYTSSTSLSMSVLVRRNRIRGGA